MSGRPTLAVKLDDGSGTFSYDVTAYVDMVAGVSIQRGRADELTDIQASQLSLTLDNSDGRFTLGSTTIGTTIKVDMPIRVTMQVSTTTVTKFTGYVQSWPVNWNGGLAKMAKAPITATDVLARLSRHTLSNVVAEELAAATSAGTTLVGYYPLSEPSSATTAGSIAKNPQGVVSLYGSGTAMAFGTDGGPVTDGLTCATFNGGTYLVGDLTTPIPATGTFSLGMWVSTTTTANGVSVLLTSSKTSAQMSLTWGTAATGDFTTDAGTTSGMTGYTGWNDGAVHLAVITFEAGNFGHFYMDGILLRTSSTDMTGETLSFDRIYIGGPPLKYTASLVPFTGNLAHVFLTTTALTLAQTQTLFTAGGLGFTGESSDTRITRLAKYGGVASASTALETGVQSVPFVDHSGQSALAAINAVALGEGGLVFARGDGKLVLQNRRHRELTTLNNVSATSEAIDPATGFTADPQQLVNYATASRAGSGADQLAANNTSITNHELYPTSLNDLMVMLDDEAFQHAAYLCGMRNEVAARLPSADIDLLSQTQSVQLAFLSMELSDRLTLTSLPSQAPGSSVDVMVEGWTETLTATSWVMTVNSSPYSFVKVWVLDDSTLSVLGSTTKLSY